MRPTAGLAILLVIASLSLAGATGTTFQPTREFEFRYHVQVEPVPEAARQLRLWVPLARSTDHQTILARTIHVPARYRIHKDPEYGNEFLYVTLTQPLPASLDLEIAYHALTRRQVVPLTGADERRHGHPGRLHLKSNRLMPVNANIQALADEITEGKKTPLEKAQAIWDFVLGNMIYEKETPGWGRGDTWRACLVGRGNCTDFHSLYISLARAAEVPARFHIGASLPQDPEAEIPGYHCWADVYVPGHGWVPLDASEAWKHPEQAAMYFGTYDGDRFLLTTGRDIRLTPPPADGEPINIFIYPHVEIDGQVFDQVKTTFRYKEVPGTKKEVAS